MRDKKIPKTIVRNSTIPEELGRISYMFTDKTGTLTQNIMHFKKLQLEPPLSHDHKDLEIIREYIYDFYSKTPELDESEQNVSPIEISDCEIKKKSQLQIFQLVKAMAICHNVTPVTEEDGSKSYQASSPDEIALVKFTENINLTLIFRTSEEIHLKTPSGDIEKYDVLHIFPFTSESKRMGIIVQNCETRQIIFYLKGAETVMKDKIEPVYWLQEEVDNIAREGLRTLVFAQRIISQDEYDKFTKLFDVANSVIQNRESLVQSVIDSFEVDMQILGISGVEDKLQTDVKETLELLKQAGISV